MGGRGLGGAHQEHRKHHTHPQSHYIWLHLYHSKTHPVFGFFSNSLPDAEEVALGAEGLMAATRNTGSMWGSWVASQR